MHDDLLFLAYDLTIDLRKSSRALRVRISCCGAFAYQLGIYGDEMDWLALFSCSLLSCDDLCAARTNAVQS